MLFSPLLPNSWLDFVIPFAYPLAAWSLAESFQMTKQAIADSQAYEFQSAWNVIAVSMVFLAGDDRRRLHLVLCHWSPSG